MALERKKKTDEIDGVTKLVKILRAKETEVKSRKIEYSGRNQGLLKVEIDQKPR